MQINVETKFLLVNQNWFEQIGFDLDIVFNANNNQVRTGAGDRPVRAVGRLLRLPRRTPTAVGGLQRQLPGRCRRPQPGRRLLTTRAGRRRAAERGEPRAARVAGGRPAELAGHRRTSLAGDFATGILNQAPLLGIGQFLDDIQVDFLVQATQADQHGEPHAAADIHQRPDGEHLCRDAAGVRVGPAAPVTRRLGCRLRPDDERGVEGDAAGRGCDLGRSAVRDADGRRGAWRVHRRLRRAARDGGCRRPAGELGGHRRVHPAAHGDGDAPSTGDGAG